MKDPLVVAALALADLTFLTLMSVNNLPVQTRNALETAAREVDRQIRESQRSLRPPAAKPRAAAKTPSTPSTPSTPTTAPPMNHQQFTETALAIAFGGGHP